MNGHIMHIAKKCFLIPIFILFILIYSPAGAAADGSSDSAVQDLIIEKDKNSNVLVTYTITKPVYLIIRVHSLSQTFPLVKQVLPHALRNIGKYTEVWDGRDESGHYIDKWQISVRTEPVELSPEVSLEIEGLKAILPNTNALPLNHFLHDPHKCGVFNINFTNIADGSSIQGIYNATMKAQGFYGYTKEIGVNLRVFIDSQMVYELSLPFDKVSELTFDVPIDVSALPSGRHILRAIIFDYADHYGTASVEFMKP